MNHIEKLKDFEEDRIYTVKSIINDEDVLEDFDNKSSALEYIEEIYHKAQELDVFILEEYDDDIEEECVYTKGD